MKHQNIWGKKFKKINNKKKKKKIYGKKIFKNTMNWLTTQLPVFPVIMSALFASTPRSKTC